MDSGGVNNKTLVSGDSIVVSILMNRTDKAYLTSTLREKFMTKK